MRKIIALLLIFTPLIYAPVMAATSQSDQPSGQIAYVQLGKADNGKICIHDFDHAKIDYCNARAKENTDQSPVWSPDGKSLLFHQPYTPEVPDSYVWNIDDDSTQVIETRLLHTSVINWSPDATTFLMLGTTTSGASSNIYSMEADGSNLRILTDTTEYPIHPSWSPDGKQIAYVSGYPDASLTLMEADGSNVHPLTEGMKVSREAQFAWSPDGKQIAFVVNGEPNKMDENNEIYVINSDGSNLRQLTKTGGVNLNPQWSPNGKQLVFYGYAAGAFADVSSTTSLQTEVFLINADGSDLTDLTQNTGLDYQPVWSPDGEWIAFASTRKWENDDWRPGIFVMRSDGTEVSMVTNEPLFSEGGREANHPVWRPEPIKP